jgi:hypothetical protein
LALLDVVRSTVVVRGEEAMAPRELLPLKLPEEPDRAGQDVVGEDVGEGETTDDDFKPFARGPEITEIH